MEVVSDRASLLNESFDRFLTFGLQPDLPAFQGYFPNLPQPILSALFDLYRQVLLHVEVNSKAEFVDICEEHCIRQQLAEVEQLSTLPQHADASRRPKEEALLIAETGARVSAKHSEVYLLSEQLAQATRVRNQLAAAKAQRESHAAALAAGYQAVAGSVRLVYEASKGLPKE